MKGQVLVNADARTNQLILSSTPDRIKMALEVVKDLDVDTEPEVKVRFFPLQYADAQAAATQLNNLFEQPQGSANGQSRSPFFFFGGQSNTNAPSGYAGLKRNVVVPDVRTNSLIVTATEQNMKSFEIMIKQIDAPKVLSEVTGIYPLKYATAATVASALTQLFRGASNNSSSRYGGYGYIFGLGSNNQDNSSPLSQLENITVIAEPKTNCLLVTGPPNTAPLVSKLVEQLDKRTAQVFVEVAIVDVTLDQDNQFGVEWQWHDANNTASNNLGQAALTTGLKYSILKGNVSALLHAIQTRSDVKVISTPSITTADNVKAVISIGESVPYVADSTLSAGNVVNNINWKPVAVSLTVTPHVNGSTDFIGLDVNQTINEIVGNDDKLNAPIFADREAQTSVVVKDGQAMVIGGIMQDKKTRDTKGVPILSSIPLLGHLFKTTDHQTTKSELMVFLTPHIIKNEQDMANVTSETQKRLPVPCPSLGNPPAAGGAPK